jgi:signal peptidase I
MDEPSRDLGGSADREPVKRRSSGAEGDSVLAFLRELPVLLLVAFVLAFLLRTFVLQVFYIPSESMLPTLQVNDRMVVEKITYLIREPMRGEIVVFEGEDTVDPTAGMSAPAKAARAVGQFLGVVPVNAQDFVKRVVGLPGDTVVVEEGQVLVNGEPLDEPYVVFDDGRSHGPFEVPEGALFVLGDNRPNSSDSRFGLGYVELDRVVGRAVLVIWPVEHAGVLANEDDEVPTFARPEPVALPALP